MFSSVLGELCELRSGCIPAEHSLEKKLERSFILFSLTLLVITNSRRSFGKNLDGLEIKQEEHNILIYIYIYIYILPK